MGDCQENREYMTKRLCLRLWSGFQLGCAVFLITWLAGCAPTLYSVDLRYIPTPTSPKIQAAKQPVGLTVAVFQDLRKVADNIQIGRVIKSTGEVVPVLPKFVRPPQAVTEPIKTYFRQAGYRVAAESPAWDLKEGNINKGWEAILIGGSIDELDILCENSLTLTKYKARVKLTLYFANTLKGKIFHTLTAESSTSLDHILFTEGKMEDELNTALAGAIEKLFEGRNIAAIIDEGSK